MTIVITRPDFFTAEAERITELLLSGQASLVHIRKPAEPPQPAGTGWMAGGGKHFVP